MMKIPPADYGKTQGAHGQEIAQYLGKVLWLAAALIFISPGLKAAWGAEVCHHDLKVKLQPEAHRLLVQDDIRVAGWKGGEISFLFSDKANIKSVLVNGKPSKYSFSSGKLTLSGVSAARGSFGVSISFDAVFNDPVDSEPASFDNPGLGVAGSISDRGTFLLADSGWYPRFACRRAATVGLPSQPALPKIAEGEIPEDFDLEVTAPRGIYAVTAGELIGHEDRNANSISTWKTGQIGQGLALSAGRYIIRSLSPQTGLTLIARGDSASAQTGSGGSPPRGDFASRQPDRGGSPPVYTYFTSENDALSETYLKAAVSHIKFYERLHGPYPFPKFAIVENFFPTGYGFPSYTLLGATVLRLPFIPETSLRHEIAHSWWGNGVLVDYASGNWCEGLTTYVADYLSQEMSSAADARLYREQILQEYATFAASGADFPLRFFEGRSSPATKAVGYGKAAFVFHMIRQKLGDDAFWNSLRQIYKERLFVRTSWEDFRDAFVRTGGWDPAEAKEFFDQWVARSGAPVLRLQDVRLNSDASGWQATGSIDQDPPWYDLDITVALKISPNQRFDTRIGIKGGSTSFAIGLPRTGSALKPSEAPTARGDFASVQSGSGGTPPRGDSASVQSGSGGTPPPQKLIADPDVNTFRLLDPEEIPCTVNSVKGSKSLTAVLRDGSPREAVKAFELLLEGLGHADARITSEKEAEMKMSKQGDFLFFGLPRSEKLKSFFSSSPEDVTLAEEKFSVKGLSGADCLFLVLNESNRGAGITALYLPVSGASADSVLTAARKITHYGKYSYLAFSQGVIRQKGVWEVLRSPLQFDFISK
ncbi:MAG: M1 family aminopeptidase [Syntrophobacteraceae bacterium]